MPVDVYTDAHLQTIKLDLHEVARRLVLHLGPTLTALLAGAKDRKLPHRWAQSDGPTPRDEAAARLLAAHQLWVLLTGAESDHVARAWFIGSNPRLGDEQP